MAHGLLPSVSILGCHETSRPAGRPADCGWPPGSITGGVMARSGSPPTAPDTGVSNGAGTTCVLVYRSMGDGDGLAQSHPPPRVSHDPLDCLHRKL
ncbi:hypothetical protein BS78_01G054100 [Paspalum vaginatum]|nr:hypothetical protein BS78_01G054100 [Paspalum vaginatum]